jgi:DNA-binding FrmR family transcriptional regulator
MARKSRKSKECCSVPEAKIGTDHRGELMRVNRIRGQVEGIGRMIEAQEYCPEIVTQIQAVRSSLASLQSAILARHLENCVRGRIKNDLADDLVSELSSIFKNFG